MSKGSPGSPNGNLQGASSQVSGGPCIFYGYDVAVGSVGPPTIINFRDGIAGPIIATVACGLNTTRASGDQGTTNADGAHRGLGMRGVMCSQYLYKERVSGSDNGGMAYYKDLVTPTTNRPEGGNMADEDMRF